MSDENLFQPPDSDVEPEVSDNSSLNYTGPKSRGIESAIDWIGSGWGIFKQAPGQWILTIIVFFVISIILSFIPILGQIASMLLTYVWLGGFMIGCQEVRDGKAFKIEHLFAGFSQSIGSLIGIGAIMLVLTIVIFGGLMGSMFLTMFMGGEPDMQNFEPSSFFLSFGIAFVLFIPVAMTVFYAPALIVLQKMNILSACKASFLGCLKNLLPLILLGIIMVIMYFVAMIPLFLGLLVVVPLFFATIFSSYEDIFLSQQTEAWSEEV